MKRNSTYFFLSSLIYILIVSYGDCNAQIVNNGSFEVPYYMPNTINPPTEGAEVTRCLSGWYDNPYYNFDSVTIPSEYPGWYQPNTSTSDYFHMYADQEDGVRPPRNAFTDMNNKQYPFYCNNDSNGRAYTGILMIRRFEYGIMDEDYSGMKNEYIQQKLDTPLAPGHYYDVSFRIAFSKSDSSMYVTGHKLNKIGAYLSVDSLGLPSNDTPFVINYNDRHMSINDPLRFLEKGGGSGYDWDIVQSNITVKGDDSLKYITIGNFQKIWTAEDMDDAPDGSLSAEIASMYYFIDSVTIVEVDAPSCYCPGEFHNQYEVTLEPIPKESQDSLCCFDVYMQLIDSSRQVCKINGVQGTYLDHPSTIEIIDTSFATIFPYGEARKIGSFCIDKDRHSFWKQFSFNLLFDNETICSFSHVYNIRCGCGCEDEGAPNENFKIEMVNIGDTTEYCCWALRVINNDPYCDILAGNIKIEIDTSDADVVITDTEDDDWAFNSNAEGFNWTNEDGLIATNDTLILGSFCMNRGYDIPVTIRYFAPGEEEPCDRIWQDTIKCSPCDTTNNCCDVLSMWWGASSWFEDGDCCRYVGFNEYFNCCDIYGYELYLKGCDGYDETPNIRDSSGQIINIHCFAHRFCPWFCSMVYLFTIKAVLLDSDGNAICSKEFDLADSCAAPPYGKVPGNYHDMTSLDHYEIIDEFYSVPNPAEEETTIYFMLMRDAVITLDIYDAMGNKVKEFNAGTAKKGMNSKIFNAGALSTGVYFVQLTAESEGLVLPITIIK